jgi:hypothetical protein
VKNGSSGLSDKLDLEEFIESFKVKDEDLQYFDVTDDIYKD